MKYLVAGRAGSGKSRICEELQTRGIPADDGDQISGLASWVELATGQKKVNIDVSKVDETKTDWLWDETVLDEWLSLPGERFLCGSAGNDLDFFNHFAKVFVLTVKPETHTARLRARPGNYIKTYEMITKKLEDQQEFVSRAVQLGAVAIDNEQPIEMVVNQILEIAHA